MKGDSLIFSFFVSKMSNSLTSLLPRDENFVSVVLHMTVSFKETVPRDENFVSVVLHVTVLIRKLSLIC